MTVKDLEAFYDYNYWANGRLLQVVSRLTPEEFTRQVAGSYGSVRNTLVHVLSTEWGWLERCGGHQRGVRLKSEDYPTFESLTATWTSVEKYVREFLSTLADEDLAGGGILAETASPGEGCRSGTCSEHSARSRRSPSRTGCRCSLRMLGPTGQLRPHLL
jgi:uncharacterized damage-inducible protein DinB